MAKITKWIHNSTESFLGGGMGALIPIRDEQMKPSKKPSETEESSSLSPNEQWPTLEEFKKQAWDSMTEGALPASRLEEE